MTKEEIIEMANQAKLPHDYVGGGLMWLDKLEQFAKLVEAKERTWVGLTVDEIAELVCNLEDPEIRIELGQKIEAKLKERNT